MHCYATHINVFSIMLRTNGYYYYKNGHIDSKMYVIQCCCLQYANGTVLGTTPKQPAV